MLTSVEHSRGGASGAQGGGPTLAVPVPGAAFVCVPPLPALSGLSTFVQVVTDCIPDGPGHLC